MTVLYRISLGDSSNESLRSLAQKRQMSAEDIATSFVLSGLENTRILGIRYLAACITTAATVVFCVWLLSISLPSATVTSETLHWIRELLFLFVPWPLTILAALWILARSESFFGILLGALGTLRKVKLFGAEIELNEQTKRRIQSATNDIEAALREYKERTDKELARVVARYQIEQTLSKFVDSPQVKSFTAADNKSFRCTIHIPAPVRYGRLYQLVDYCPSGVGRGREFSTRYGIIGKVWRTEKPLLENDLLPSLPNPRTHEEEIDQIMSNWGMNRREAENALRHRSYFCLPLVHEHRKVGLLYMDAVERDFFNSQKQNQIEAKAQEELAPLVAKILDESAAIALQIEFD